MRLISSKDNILSKVMPDYDFDNPIVEPHELEKQLIETMKTNFGRGLASPQVGIETRVFVVDFENLPVKRPVAVFNPTIISVSEEEELYEEGCLSFPGLFIQVKRPSKILAEFLDKDKNKFTITLEGVDARCFQHELDHLNGICFTDKVSKLKLDRALNKKRKRKW